MRNLRSVVAMVVFIAAATHAQTPDGATPANEGVCDDLMGFTPGLYGLCVAFCEAQDCEATLDPATSKVTFDPNCRPSSPKILEKYNSRKSPEDPSMPCVKGLVGGCRCWTEDELDRIAESETWNCSASESSGAINGLGPLGWEAVDVINDPDKLDTPFCRYFGIDDLGSRIERLLRVSDAKMQACLNSIASECAERGF